MSEEKIGRCSEAVGFVQRKPRGPPALSSGCFGVEGPVLSAGSLGGPPNHPSGSSFYPCAPLAPRILEVPYAYQCCAYGVCASFFKASGQWEAEDFHLEEEEAPKRPSGLLAGQAENHCE